MFGKARIDVSPDEGISQARALSDQSAFRQERIDERDRIIHKLVLQGLSVTVIAQRIRMSHKVTAGLVRGIKNGSK